VADAICASNFYTLDPKLQYDLKFVLMNAQKPKMLIAGKIVNLDMPGFTSVSKI